MNIYIKTTEKCNLRCKHCYNGIHNGKLDYARVALFLNKINNICNNNYFIFHGGEPLLGNITEMQNLVDTFPDNKWRITSNLSFDLSSSMKTLLNSMDEIRTSFDIGIRFSKLSSLLTWMKNVKDLSKSNKNIVLICCLTKTLIQHSPSQILSMAKHLGIKKLMFERISYTGDAEKNNIHSANYNEIDNWLCEMYKIQDTGYKIRISEFENIIAGITNNMSNYRGIECCQSTLTINSDNTIGRCPNNARKFIVGNLDSSVNNIISQKVCTCYTINNHCLECDYYERCHGGCASQTWQDNTCPYPKKLSDLIYGDLYEHISVI